MNLVILEENQFITENRALLSPRQTEHIDKILKLNLGDSISVGKIDGNMGNANLGIKTQHGYEIENINLNIASPKNIPVTLILAMPRPQMLKRILQTIACIGVSNVHFIQTSKVEKSFWGSPSATNRAIHEQLKLGLEQGVATQLPNTFFHRRFKPFVEDELSSLLSNGTHLIAHPQSSNSMSQFIDQKPVTIAIGPEGGFLDQEVEMFEANGFIRCNMGTRILKVETAVTALLAKLFL